jgi:DNA-binding transcriptional ArsR family regulator
VVVSGTMQTAHLVAEVASLVGDPARATMLTALVDGRALTATELAYSARITRQTASTHLAKLTEAGLLTSLRCGRHRYFRLASSKIVEMLDGIVAVVLENRPRYRPLTRQAKELSAARICYVHLAGRLSVELTDFFTAHEYVVLSDEAAEITALGTGFLNEFGIDLSALVRPAAASADSASTGRNDDRISRARQGQHSRNAILISAGSRGCGTAVR